MRFARPRWAAASTLAAAAAAAVIVTGSLLTGGPAVAAGAARPARPSPVLVSCAAKEVTRPSSFVLTCADANWGYLHMHWQTWGPTAYATATTYVNDCDPDCAQGKFYYFPTLVVVWRPEALAGPSGGRYFTRLSWIFETRACLPAPPPKDKLCLPPTDTFKLVDWK